MTPPTANPWKKRRQGPQEFMPPSRALLAEKDGKKATATWGYYGDGIWRCISASGILKSMKGQLVCPQRTGALIRAKLEVHGFHWHWIEPNTVRVMEPPF